MDWARTVRCAVAAIVVGGRLPGATAESVRTVVWIDPVLETRAAVDTHAVRDALAAAGLEPVSVDTAQLARGDVLDPTKIALLVLPYGGCYPATGLDALGRYLRRGGACVAFGTQGFGVALFPVDNRWITLDTAADAAPTPVPGRGWDVRTHGEGGPLAMSGDGTDSAPLRFACADLGSYRYASVPTGPLPARGALIVFEARADDATPHLCLELQQRDGSRWKQIVSVSADWREFRVHTAGFVAYARKDGANAPVNPKEVTHFRVGLFKGLAGDAPHSFQLRRVRIVEAVVPGPMAFDAGAPVEGRDLLDRYLGKHLPPAPTRRWPDLFGEGAQLARITLAPVHGHPLTAGLAPSPGAFDARLLADPAPRRAHCRIPIPGKRLGIPLRSPARGARRCRARPGAVCRAPVDPGRWRVGDLRDQTVRSPARGAPARTLRARRAFSCRRRRARRGIDKRVGARWTRPDRARPTDAQPFRARDPHPRSRDRDAGRGCARPVRRAGSGRPGRGLSSDASRGAGCGVRLATV